MRFAMVITVLVALGAPAGADRSERERSVGVVVIGDGSLVSKVESRIGEHLAREGYPAVERPLSKDALETLMNCFILDDHACARGVVETRSRTPRLVIARLDSSLTAGDVKLVFTWFAHGREPVIARATCEECYSSWQRHTDRLMAELFDRAEMPILTVEPDPEQPKRKPSRLWPGLLIGVGAATLITGGVMLYYGLRDGPEYKYVYPQLTPVGISLIAVGGGALIGGMISW